ncbi:MAG: hypothetical protein ABFS03_13445, partial [Chloroflexota bacterium]
MDWKKFFIVFLRNLILSIGLAIIILGVFGYLVAGKEGLVNGATWGLILGLVGGFSSGLMVLPKYWGDYAGRY